MKNFIIAFLICHIAATARSDSENNWSEASPDKTLLATIRRLHADEDEKYPGLLRVTVFRRAPDGTPGQKLASTDIGGRILQVAHWSPDSQFFLFTTSLSGGAHGGWHYTPFLYCAADQSFRSGLEEVVGNVLASEFGFESPDLAVLTLQDGDAPGAEEMPSKQVKVSLSKILPKLEREGSEETVPTEKGKDLKSEAGTVKTQITFVNRSKQPVKVYWLGYKGERVLYKTLKASESYTQDTFMTHPWLITDLHHNTWDVYMPTVQPRTVIIMGPKKR